VNFWDGLVLGVMSMIVLDSWSTLREIKRNERKTARIRERS
jgi:hypothetical protein